MLKLIKYILVVPIAIIMVASIIVGAITEAAVDALDRTAMKWLQKNSEKLTYGTVAVGLILVLIISIFQ